jgi:poly(hydroxyalkanoate) depolymerase family esterase
LAISISELLKAVQQNPFARRMDAMRLIRRALGLIGTQPPRAQPPAGPAAVLKQKAQTVVPAQPRPALQARPVSFTEHDFQFADACYAYRLYLPAIVDTDTLLPALSPLVVLLHGCQQDAADFAQGTAMNELAEQKKCIVLYPEQLSKANSMRCWNWFQTAHQERHAGEPGMIAALTRRVIQSHNADPARVYIAGLSAGGAMAAVVAGLYPELFAALGVHSGIPTGVASDVVSALSAMRRGARRPALAEEKDSMMPTIVFHGSGDKTVHPDNGDQIAEAALAALGASGLALEKSQRTEKSAASTGSSRSALRTLYRAADGKAYVEHWSVGSGPHAWSGGNTAGSFTDPQGPDASLAMLEFFLQHHK